MEISLGLMVDQDSDMLIATLPCQLHLMYQHPPAVLEQRVFEQMWKEIPDDNETQLQMNHLWPSDNDKPTQHSLLQVIAQHSFG